MFLAKCQVVSRLAPHQKLAKNSPLVCCLSEKVDLNGHKIVAITQVYHKGWGLRKNRRPHAILWLLKMENHNQLPRHTNRY